MKRLQKIFMLDRIFMLFVFGILALSGVVLVYNQLYIQSFKLFAQFIILFVIGVMGIAIWRKNKA